MHCACGFLFALYLSGFRECVSVSMCVGFNKFRFCRFLAVGTTAALCVIRLSTLFAIVGACTRARSHICTKHIHAHINARKKRDMAVAKAAVAVDWNAYFWVTHKIEKSGYTHGPNRDYAEKER